MVKNQLLFSHVNPDKNKHSYSIFSRHELKINTKDINLKLLSKSSLEGIEIPAQLRWLQAMMKRPATKILTNPPMFKRTISNMQLYVDILNFNTTMLHIG